MVLLYIFFNAWIDFRNKKISFISSLFFFVLGGLIVLICQEKSVTSSLLGMVCGLVLLAVSFLTRNAIGKGDGIIFIVTGIFLGWNNNIILLFYSFLFCGIFSLFILVLCKRKGKDRIVFVPFVLFAYIIILGMGGFV